MTTTTTTASLDNLDLLRFRFEALRGIVDSDYRANLDVKAHKVAMLCAWDEYEGALYFAVAHGVHIAGTVHGKTWARN